MRNIFVHAACVEYSVIYKHKARLSLKLCYPLNNSF
jgi:hypothetical protein